MKKILVIGIGLFSYQISNIKSNLVKADKYFFANTKEILVLPKLTNAVDLKEEKRVWNYNTQDMHAENQYYLQEPYIHFIIGFGIINYK